MVMADPLDLGHGKKTINFYCGPWLEGELVTKPNKSYVMFGILGVSQVFCPGIKTSLEGELCQEYRRVG